MEFTAGQLVVHPRHGPAVVRSVLTRTVRGNPVKYIALHVDDGDLEISFPQARADELGVRNLRSQAELDALLAIAAEPGEPLESQWSRRMKDYRDRVASAGDSATIAVVRDLARRGIARTLSLAERELLREAGTPLVREWALIWQVPVLEAQKRLSSAIFGRVVDWSVDVDPAHTLG